MDQTEGKAARGVTGQNVTDYDIMLKTRSVYQLYTVQRKNNCKIMKQDYIHTEKAV